MKEAIAVLLVAVPLVAATGTAATTAAQVTPASASAAALSDIPAAYLVLYQEAGQRLGVPWQILAAIGRVESDHGRNPNAYHPNSAGAVGPMQFLPSTFAEYASAAGHPGADILDPHDSIFAAAKMLNHNGAATNLWGAIYSYNHAAWYVELALSWARRYGWPG
jgi:peptidoglycan DL-endopeptidase CwlO